MPSVRAIFNANASCTWSRPEGSTASNWTSPLAGDAEEAVAGLIELDPLLLHLAGARVDLLLRLVVQDRAERVADGLLRNDQVGHRLVERVLEDRKRVV